MAPSPNELLEANETAVGSYAWFDTQAPFELWLKQLEDTCKPASSESPSGQADAAESVFRIESLVTTDCEIMFEGVLQIDGCFNGRIRSFDGTLVMSGEGKIEADIEVSTALIDGYVKGNIMATDCVVLDSHSRVVGNVTTPTLSISDGAVFEGSCMTLNKARLQEEIMALELPGVDESFELAAVAAG